MRFAIVCKAQYKKRPSLTIHSATKIVNEAWIAQNSIPDYCIAVLLTS